MVTSAGDQDEPEIATHQALRVSTREQGRGVLMGRISPESAESPVV